MPLMTPAPRFAPARVLLTVLLTLLVCRFVLLAVGANPTNPLIGGLVAVGGWLAEPLQPLFRTILYPGTPAFDWATLLVIGVLLLVAWLLHRRFPRLFV